MKTWCFCRPVGRGFVVSAVGYLGCTGVRQVAKSRREDAEVERTRRKARQKEENI